MLLSITLQLITTYIGDEILKSNRNTKRVFDFLCMLFHYLYQLTDLHFVPDLFYITSNYKSCCFSRINISIPVNIQWI